MKKAKLITSSAVVMTMVMSSIVPAFAYSKEETVYSKLKTNGSEKTTVVSEHLINDQNETSLDDQSSLKNIKNVIVSIKGSSPTYGWILFTRPPVMVFKPVSTSVTFHGSEKLL